MRFLLSTVMLFALAACHSPDEKSDDGKVPAVGGKSQMGQTLQGSDWCSEMTAESDGTLVFQVLKFQYNRLLRSTYPAQTGATLEAKAQKEGEWSLIDNQLVLTEEGTTKVYKLKQNFRTEDGVNCIQLTIDPTTQTYCSCKL